MADIKTINANGTEYSIKDETARNAIGDLTTLNTTDKTDLVTAINEITIKTLSVATSDTLGGIYADPAEEADTQPVRIGADGKPVVDCYGKSYIDTALGAYITDVAAIVGGDA